MIRQDSDASLLVRLGVGSLATLLVLTVGGLCTAEEPKGKMANKSVTYQIKNDGNGKTAKGYAVFVDVKPDNIDVTKTKGRILKNVRLEPRGALGTLIVFENEDEGIPFGMMDDIQIHFKNLPKGKVPKFSNVSTLRSGVGREGNVIEENVPRIGFMSDKDPEYTILNAPGQSPFIVDNLQALVNVAEIIDTAPLLDFSNSFGFTPLSPGTTFVDSLSSPAIPILGTVDLDKWFYVRGKATIDSSEIPFVHGVSEFVQVPEPPGLILFGLGLVGACGYAWRRRAPAGATLTKG